MAKTPITKNEYNAIVIGTHISQTPNEILGTKEKTLYYLVIATEQGTVNINVGEKTVEKIKQITEKKGGK